MPYNLENFYEAAEIARNAGLPDRFVDGCLRLVEFELAEDENCPVPARLESVLRLTQDDLPGVIRGITVLLDARSKHFDTSF